ncbi:PAS and ANTAR domain-containing protein [Nocardia takedensis]|uniref:PAS and ANTAR domain-containing protein n=1 Tax=Nocardia takedensis TaxID=259390 RepID=UPI003F75BCB2
MDEVDIPPPPARARIAQGTGSFRFWFAGTRWEWSDEVAALHGYGPGEMREPSMERVLSHKHPDDRDQVADTLAAVVATGAAFSSRHRIIDTHGATRDVLVVGDRLRDASGAVVGTAGFYVDVTDTVAAERREILDDELPVMVAARAAIEQAKGVVMFVYGISEAQAFDVLVWRSQETNVRVRTLAEKLVAALADFRGASTQTRTRFDHLLLTVHERP